MYVRCGRHRCVEWKSGLASARSGFLVEAGLARISGGALFGPLAVWGTRELPRRSGAGSERLSRSGGAAGLPFSFAAASSFCLRYAAANASFFAAFAQLRAISLSRALSTASRPYFCRSSAFTFS